MKKLNVYLWSFLLLLVYKVSYSQDSQFNNKMIENHRQKLLFIQKHASYTGFWMDMTGYAAGQHLLGTQISGRLGYGYFITDKLSPIFSGIYSYARQTSNSDILQSRYMALMPAVRYYFTKYNRLFVEGSYIWAFHHDLYINREEKNYSTQVLGMGIGFNLPLLRKGKYKWLNKNLSFEGIYNYFRPISRQQSVYLNGSKIRWGLVMYF